MAGKIPLKNTRYSPCLAFGGYVMPTTYYQNQNKSMITHPEISEIIRSQFRARSCLVAESINIWKESTCSFSFRKHLSQVQIPPMRFHEILISKVVSTHLWNTPRKKNLYQQAISRDSFHNWRGLPEVQVLASQVIDGFLNYQEDGMALT